MKTEQMICLSHVCDLLQPKATRNTRNTSKHATSSLAKPPVNRHAISHLTCEKEEPAVRAPADRVAMRAAELERRLSLNLSLIHI